MISPGPVFEKWCVLQGIAPVPAAPATIASFVTACAPMGIQTIVAAIGDISRAHYLQGLADPTLGGLVAAAVNDISKIDPPRSWPKEHKAQFLALPYQLQVYVSAREIAREKEIRRAQNDAAVKRKAAA